MIIGVLQWHITCTPLCKNWYVVSKFKRGADMDTAPHLHAVAPPPSHTHTDTDINTHTHTHTHSICILLAYIFLFRKKYRLKVMGT